MLRALFTFLFFLAAACSPGNNHDSSDLVHDDTSDDISVNADDPLNQLPPEINWNICGSDTDAHACNIMALDHIGQPFNMYMLYGKSIVLDFSTMWCGPCNSAAVHAQEVQDSYRNAGLVYITVLIENLYGESPSSDDVQDWVNHYGITDSPVIAGNRGWLQSSGGDWAVTGWPTFYYIDKEMVIRDIDRGYNEQEVIFSIEWLIGL